MALTKVAPAGIGSTPGDGYRIGSSFLHSTGVELTNANASGIVTAAQFDGKLNIGIATFTDDVKFTGDAANLTWDKSTDDLIFDDNARAIFGTNSDGLHLYHNSSNSFIDESGTGSLYISAASDIYIRAYSTNKTMFRGTAGGEAGLYYNNTKRISTSGIGATVTGQLDVGNVNSTGVITATKFVGDIAVGSSITYADTEKAYFGTDLDLKIHHTSGNSFIENTTNDLNITNTGDDIVITANDDINLKTNAGDNAVNILGGAAVELYHNGSPKLETTSSGIDVTGSVVADDLIVTGTSVVADLKSTNNNYVLGLAGNNSSVKAYFGTDSSGNFKLATGSGVVERLQIDNEGLKLKNLDAGGGISINALNTTSNYALISANANRPSENDLILGISGSWNGDSVAQIDFRCGADTTNKDDGKIMFFTQATNSGGLRERIRITADGEVLIGGRSNWGGSNLHPNDINKLVVTGTSPADTFDSQLHLEGSETSGAANTGGALAFAGHDGGNYRNWANIYGMKENGTSGNQDSYLSFHTRANGGSPGERLRITSDGTAQFKGNIEVDTGSAATIDFGDITSAYGRLYADSTGTFIGSKSAHDLFLRTNNTNRIKIANNSAATSIGGAMAFNAMLTTQGDVSGGLLMLKAAENTNRLFVSGTDSNGVEVNLYDDAGGQRGILGVSSSNNEFFIKSPNSSSQLKFYTNDGYGTVWRAQLTKHGIFRAHGFSRSSGTNSQGYNNLRSGYQGDDLSLGPSALYYVGHKNSSSTSNYQAHEVTMYTSGHWGQYQQLIIYAKQHYYHTGYRVWHIDNGGNITLKEDYGGGNMNNTGVSHGGQQTVGSGTHGGQNVYKYELTFTNNGTYVQTKWFVGWIGSGGAGHIGNSKTVAQADAHFRTNGGGLHFVNVAHESLQASSYYQY